MEPATPRKKMTKQLTGKREDTDLHSWSRSGNINAIREVLRNTEKEKLAEMLAKQNSCGETPLYVAVEYGYFELVRELIYHYDLTTAGMKAKNGFDALHIAAKQGDLGMYYSTSIPGFLFAIGLLACYRPGSRIKRDFAFNIVDVMIILMDAHPELAMTVDNANTTALHTAANQGHKDVVNYLLEVESSLSTVAKSNGKTALHSSSRNGHVEVVKALLSKDPGILTRNDKKGQTALHMAVKGPNSEVVKVLIKDDPTSINIVDTKGNTALHIATRKGKAQMVKLLLSQNEMDTKVINRSNETALDTAEKMERSHIIEILQEYGVPSARTLPPQTKNPARELKQTVSDIKHEVHDQLEHTRQTRQRVQGIAKRLNKMHAEGLNNAINSTTVVAVLIATVTFAAIFTVPGQYVQDPGDIPPGSSIGAANIAENPAFLIFFVFDSVALFISLAVVVVQTSVVVIESKAKKQMMAIINKLMWLACVMVSVAFLAMSFVVVGKEEIWMAICVTIIGTTILATTLGIMCYWVILHRIESKKNKRSILKNAQSNKSMSFHNPLFPDTELIENDFKKMYAI